MPYKATDIAQDFVLFSEDDGGIVLGKLQALLYYAQGTFPALTGQTLFDEEIFAGVGEGGPVILSAKDKYQSFGDDTPILPKLGGSNDM